MKSTLAKRSRKSTTTRTRSKKTNPPLKDFDCSYAYDLSVFQDFKVSAVSERAAKRKILKALKEGRFENVSGQICWENVSGHRVFVNGQIKTSLDAQLDTMEEVIQRDS